MRIVCDLDDTLCRAGKDFGNAIPITDVIEKIRQLKRDGHEIIIYTSRGQVSCNGDISRIESKYRSIVSAWLKDNNVPCDELIFGKPLGDLYIDDKAMYVRDFVDQEIARLNGHSGYPVIRIGNIVKKEMSETNYVKLSNWYEDSKGIARSPAIVSRLYTTMFMEYIDGQAANQCLSMEILNKIISQIFKFMDVRYYSYDQTRLLRKLDDNKSDDEEWCKIVEDCKKLITERLDMKPYASLSHSDMTLSNMIVKDGEIFLVDSMYEREASSYLMDFAKLKMSLDGYETLFCDGPTIPSIYSEQLTRRIKFHGAYLQVIILEYMYAIRLYNYNANKELVKAFARKIREEITAELAEISFGRLKRQHG